MGLDVVFLTEGLPNKPAAWVIGKQVLRSATSVGANYRAACRAKSTADFIYKLKIVEEEADETLFWLDLLEESGMVNKEKVQPIKKETDEVLSIIVASIKTLRKKQTMSGKP